LAGTILCVDSDRSLTEILASAMSGEGYTVITATDGDHAVELVSEHEPDLVMVDLILPRRDGFAVLEAIRAMPGEVADTKALILSGCTQTPHSRDRAIELGVFQVLIKPVPLAELLTVVARCMGEVKKAVSSDPLRVETASRELSGTLEQMSIPELLHHLHGLRATGVLHLLSARKRKWIELRDGYPMSIRSNLVNECLGNFLVRGGKISQAVMAESRRRMKEGRLQGEILVAMEILSEHEVTDALLRQANEKLLEIFAWETGTYRFEMGGELHRSNSLGLVGSPANLILRGVCERFSLSRVESHLRSHADCFVAPGESPFYQFQEIALDPEHEEMLSGLSGSVRLSQFLTADEKLKRTLYALITVGLLELRAGAALSGRSAPRRAAQPSKPTADDERRARLTVIAEQIRSQTYFEILGIDTNASADETRSAYERLAAKMHPDQYNQASRAVQQMAERVFEHITLAYQTLSDQRRKSEYVLSMRRDERNAEIQLESERALEAEKEFQRGEALLAKRAYEKALSSFGKALELYPGEGDYHAHYGYALHLCHPGDASMVQEAMEHVLRGIKLAGHREKSYLFMGRLYKAIGRPGTAEKMFARAVQIQPQSVEAQRELRLISMRRGKHKGLIRRLLRR
jgi:DNA-binding response OmpR family regulator/tetratricopeptide (TPR) repeat protein